MYQRGRLERAVCPALTARGEMAVRDGPELVIRELREPIECGCRVGQKISCFLMATPSPRSREVRRESGTCDQVTKTATGTDMKRPMAFRASFAAALLCHVGHMANAQAVAIDFSRVEWKNLSPKDTAARFAVLHGDSISGSTQMLYRFPPNMTSPCHWHTAAQGTVVLQGSLKVRHRGTGADAPLGIGGYSFVPARTPFQVTTGPTVTVIVASLDGPFDIHAVAGDQCGPAMPPGQTERSAVKAEAFEVDSAKIPWTSFPTKGSPVRIAMLHVDSTSGTTHMLFRIPPNDASPCHWHSASESNFVVQGSVGMRHAGMAERAALGVGGFSFVPKRMGHQISTGPTTVLVFSSLDVRFDFHAVDDAQCVAAGSR